MRAKYFDLNIVFGGQRWGVSIGLELITWELYWRYAKEEGWHEVAFQFGPIAFSWFTSYPLS